MNASERELRLTQLIWGAIVMGATMAAGVFVFLARTSSAAPAPSLAMLPKVAAVVAVGCIVASRWLPRRMQVRAPGTAAQVHRTRVIVGAMLCEGAVLLALAAHFLTRSDEALAVAAVPYVALLALFPTHAQVDELERSSHGPGAA
jgi:hypothetical protein